jgi:SAM-dependent methyltransferase
VRENYHLTCAAYLVMNHLESLRYEGGNIRTNSGTAHGTFSLDESLDYIYEVFNDYKSYGGFPAFRGRVAEIGAGDNVGVAMLMLADGAERVDLPDRYFSVRDPGRQRTVYERLVSQSPTLGARFRDIDLADDSAFPGMTRYYGRSAAAEVFFNDHRDYDFIVSRAVMEHLYDPESALERMASALNPGGRLVHKVDLRDHGMFVPKFDEVKFLEVPEWLYGQMTRSSGRPNRILVHRYRKTLDRTGLDYKILITRLAGVGDITPHLPYHEIPAPLRQQAEAFVNSRRASFARAFRDLPAPDLAVAGIFVIARRPLASA